MASQEKLSGGGEPNTSATFPTTSKPATYYSPLEEDRLRRALGTALEGLCQLHGIPDAESKQRMADYTFSRVLEILNE